MEEKKSKAWMLWTWLWELIAFLPDLAETWARWIVKWVVDTVDLVWDVAWWATDLLTNLVTLWKWTNIWTKEWWLDKWSKKTKEWIDKYGDSQKSKIWDTTIWKWILWVTELAWEIYTPWLWIWVASLKWLKMWKKAWDIFKKTPWAKKELEALMKTWKKIEQSQIDDMVKKYWAWATDIAKKEATAASKFIWASKEAKLELKDLKNLKAEEIAKLPDTLKKKLYKLTWAWVIWSWIALDFPEQPSEIDDKDLEEINNILSTDESWEKSDTPYMYRWRKIIKNDDWTFSFISKDWSWREKKFNSMEELQWDVNSLWMMYEWSDNFKKAQITFDNIKKVYPDVEVSTLLSDYIKESKLKNNEQLAKNLWFTEYDWSPEADIELLYLAILSKEVEWITI